LPPYHIGGLFSDSIKFVFSEQKIPSAKCARPAFAGILIYCADFHCGHAIAISADQVRLSDIELQFVCTACGKKYAEVRPDWRTVRVSHGGLPVGSPTGFPSRTFRWRN
jgi:hypothetical protein